MVDVLQIPYCPRCGLVGDDVGQCGSASVIPCADPQMIDFETVVLMRCGTCDRSRALSVDDIMHGRTSQHASGCQLTFCAAKILLPAPETIHVEVPVDRVVEKEVIKEVIPAAAQKRLDELDRLEAAGVDNWEGYSEAFKDEEEEEEAEGTAPKAKPKA